MSGTAESDATLYSQWPDNTSGLVTPALGRDVIASKFNVFPAVISAAGSTQGTATVLVEHLNVVTTCASGAGVKATALYTQVWNFGANPCLVYPITGALFNSQATNAPVTVGVGGMVTIVMTSSTQGWAL